MRIKSILLFLVILAIGVGLISTSFTNRADYPVSSFVGCLILGLFMVFGAGVVLKMLVIPGLQDRDSSIREEVSDFVRADQTGARDSDATDSLVTSFRVSFRNFFAAPGVPENSALQDTATQLYWHILYLQKKRMERLGVTMDFDAVRMSYAGVSITKNHYTDGKYRISDVEERISATRTYTDSARRTHKKTDRELAHYSILNARQTTDSNSIVCPNCGNITTRENLLDGCDYCGTKFTVEDLGPRVSSFALRSDYETEYDKYRDQRSYYGNRAFLAGAVAVFLIGIIAGIGSFKDLDGGIGMNIVAIFFAALFCAVIVGFLTRWFFWLTIFPVIQAKKSITYHSKKKAAELREARSENDEIEQRIKAFDRLFSTENFFSNVQNKLAAIHYADSAAQVRAFATIGLDGYLGKYRNIIDMDAADMSLLSFRTDDSTQRVEVRADLLLTHAPGVRFSTSPETVFLTLEKSASCKTPAVCAPSVMTCKGCGSSLSLLEGGKCRYCGRELDLKQYDWVITDYRTK